MTYMSRRYGRRRARGGLSGFFDDLVDSYNRATGQSTSAESQCIATANEALAPFDAKITDLATTWQPTGFYTPSELRDIVAATMRVVVQAQASVDQAAREPSASQDSIRRATDDLARAGGRSIDYLTAATTAEQQGLRVVNAAGLKRWVTDTLAAASSGMVTASVIGCIRPWWVGAMTMFQAVFDVAWAVAKKTAGAALAIGETALKVVGDLPDIYEMLKWPAILFGAYWLWTQIDPRGGHSP